MKERMIAAFGLLVLFVFLSGCETVQMLIQKPEVSVKSVKASAISFQEITLDMDLLIENPNPVGISLSSFDYGLMIEDQGLLKGTSGDGLDIEALGSSVVTVPLTVNFKELYAAVSSMLNQDESAYRIDTGFNFMLPVLGEQRVELSHEGTFPNIRMPSFSFKNLYVKSLGLMGADLIVTMEVENPNAFDVGLNGFDGEFRINKETWSQLSVNQSVEFASRGMGEIGFEFRLDFLSMGRTVRDLLTSSEPLNYDFTGEVSLDSSLELMSEALIPLNFQGGVDLVHPDTTTGEHSSIKIEDSIEKNLINIFGMY